MTGKRATAFWAGCAAISLGVLLHLPMYSQSLSMGHHMSAMPMDKWMVVGMGLIVLGALSACYGALTFARRDAQVGAGIRYEADPNLPIGRSHVAVLLVLVIGLVIDTMKPATLGFVLPGLADEYGISRSEAAYLPLVALIGTTVGSIVWGYLADLCGRRATILLSTILFIATSVCGAMPTFGWNLVMCFLMGSSAGGMLPVVYTLLTEIMPARSRSWVLVLVGGTGLVGGYLAASSIAALFEPQFGWRSLWLQGFPTGLLLLLLARYIPESPAFLAARGQTAELEKLNRRFGIVARPAEVVATADGKAQNHNRVTAALMIAALAWSLVNFGLLLWLPSNLQQRGLPSGVASGVIASSALIALPTVAFAAYLYSRWSSKWTLVGSLGATIVALAATLLLDADTVSRPMLIAVVALLIIGSNAVIAVLLPYAAENYRMGVRGRATGFVAGSSKVGGVMVQLAALVGFIPSFGSAALLLILPLGLAAALVGYAGPETRGRSLRDLEQVTG